MIFSHRAITAIGFTLILSGATLFDSTNISFSLTVKNNPNRSKEIEFVTQGLEKFERGDYQGAIAEYTRAIQVAPDNEEAYIRRGLTYRSLGDLNRAIADFDRAIEIAPNQPLALYNRGEAYSNLNKLPQALADSNKALDLKPGYSETFNNRGVVS